MSRTSKRSGAKKPNLQDRVHPPSRASIFPAISLVIVTGWRTSSPLSHTHAVEGWNAIRWRNSVLFRGVRVVHDSRIIQAQASVGHKMKKPSSIVLANRVGLFKHTRVYVWLGTMDSALHKVRYHLKMQFLSIIESILKSKLKCWRAILWHRKYCTLPDR